MLYCISMLQGILVLPTCSYLIPIVIFSFYVVCWLQCTNGIITSDLRRNISLLKFLYFCFTFWRWISNSFDRNSDFDRENLKVLIKFGCSIWRWYDDMRVNSSVMTSIMAASVAALFSHFSTFLSSYFAFLSFRFLLFFYSIFIILYSSISLWISAIFFLSLYLILLQLLYSFIHDVTA